MMPAAPRTADLFSRRRDPLQLVLESQRIARRSNLFFIDRRGRYTVFRRVPGNRTVCLGECASPAALLRKLSRCAGDRPQTQGAR